jgi:hypothetical protein
MIPDPFACPDPRMALLDRLFPPAPTVTHPECRGLGRGRCLHRAPRCRNGDAVVPARPLRRPCGLLDRTQAEALVSRPDPRCGHCNRPGKTIATRDGPRCKRCADRMPPHLRGDPAKPKPNADKGHRAGKQAGAGTPAASRLRPPPDAKQRRRIRRGEA